MSKKWGSQGWATLHSICALYPDVPTLEHRKQMQLWLNGFKDILPCPKCREHFSKMLAQFQAQFDIYKSRHTMFWFSVKAHNMVNVRLGKPQISLYANAWSMYKNNDYERIRREFYRYCTTVGIRETGVEGIRTSKIVSTIAGVEGTARVWANATNWDQNSISETLADNATITVDIATPAAPIVNTQTPKRVTSFMTKLNQHIRNHAK